MFIILISIILFVLYCILKVSSKASEMEERMRKTTIINHK